MNERERLARGEERLRRAGLRGHVYATRRCVVCFATRSERDNRNILTSVGPEPVIKALGKEGESAEETAQWIETVAQGERINNGAPAPPRWNTRALVITGAPASVALAGTLAAGGTTDATKLQTLLDEAGPDSVKETDLAYRRATGRPLSAEARKRVAEALQKPLRNGQRGWIDRWLRRATEAKRRKQSPAGLLIQHDNPIGGWAYGPRMTCGEIEASAAAVDGPESEQGRLWVQRKPNGGAEFVVLDETDTNQEARLPDSEEIANWIAANADAPKTRSSQAKDKERDGPERESPETAGNVPADHYPGRNSDRHNP